MLGSILTYFKFPQCWEVSWPTLSSRNVGKYPDLLSGWNGILLFFSFLFPLRSEASSEFTLTTWRQRLVHQKDNWQTEVAFPSIQTQVPGEGSTHNLWWIRSDRSPSPHAACKQTQDDSQENNGWIIDGLEIILHLKPPVFRILFRSVFLACLLCTHHLTLISLVIILAHWCMIWHRQCRTQEKTRKAVMPCV